MRLVFKVKIKSMQEALIMVIWAGEFVSWC